MSDSTDDPWFSADITPPYVGVLLSARRGADRVGRAALAAEAYRLAAHSPGFLGAEVCDGDDGHVMSATYWRDRPALDAWLDAIDALIRCADPRSDRARIYDHYVARIVTVEETFQGCLPARR